MLPGGVAAMPANDDCAAATVITGLDFEEVIDVSAATTEAGDPAQTCSAGGAAENSHSVWYEFTPPISGLFSASTFRSDYDTVLSYATGACGALTEYRCDDNFWIPFPTSAYTTSVVGGTSYRIEVTSHGAGPAGVLEFDFFYRPNSPVCPDGPFVTKPRLTISRLGNPLGDERMVFKGTVTVAAAPNPLADGAQVRVEDGRNGFLPVYDRSYLDLPIPAGAPGAGCDPKDGWKTNNAGTKFTYVNKSNALPPGCVPGSANGLVGMSVKARKSDPSQYTFKVKVKGGTIEAPLDEGRDVRPVVAFGATAAAGAAGSCAAVEGSFDCKTNGNGSRLRCRD